MSPRGKHEDADVEKVDVEEEISEANAGGKLAKATEKAVEVIATAKEKEPDAEVVAGAEDEEQMGGRKVNLKTLARDLYQMGLNLGLPPDEAALLTSETKLPTFIGEEDKKEFKQGLVEAYQEMLDERLQGLKQKLGVG